MIIVGELINASRKKISEAIINKNNNYIQQIAREQSQAGADYIDVNAGTFVDEEAEYLKWLVKNVQTVVDRPCCLDSSNPRAIEEALSVHQGPVMVNSISLEKDRMESLLPLVAGTDIKVVALCMSDDGMPETTEERLCIAEKLINRLTQKNISLENIYVDPLVQPIATSSKFGIAFLNAVDEITSRFEGVHTMCGLSNISFGLPNRQFLNQMFAVMAIARGLDGLIVNPLDSRMMANLIAAEALVGRDEYCTNFLKAYREERFSF